MKTQQRIITITLIILGLIVSAETWAQDTDSHFYFNGNREVLFKGKNMGAGGYAFIHGSNDQLTINYMNQFTGGTQILSNLHIGHDDNSFPTGENRRLYFQGIALNTDPIYMMKYNVATNKTDLRVCIGDDQNGDDRFVIGNVLSGTENWRDFFVVHNNGNTDVYGTLRANKVKVEVMNGADFVFENNYKLKPLWEVETFIKENKHLPDVQSEKEMQETGLDVNEFQIKLLQKVEELTLYVIEQDKQIKQLQQQLGDRQ